MKLGNQFLLPGEDAIAVAEHLAEPLRAGEVAVHLVGHAGQHRGDPPRPRDDRPPDVLLFDGKYHGEGDATLVVPRTGGRARVRGLPPWVTAQARVVAFNDVAALEAALAPGDVALVLAEPAMTNAGFLLPQPGFHDALRRLTREAGRCWRSTRRTRSSAPTPASRGEWGLEPDFLVVGKSIAAGVPLAAYGMTRRDRRADRPARGVALVSGAVVDEVATGGTLFGTRSRWRPGARRSSRC